MTMPAESPPRRRGRPPGAKNKPKEPETDFLASDDSELPEDVAPDFGAPKSAESIIKTLKKDSKAPPYRQGMFVVPIEKLYRKAGKLVKAFDVPVGTVIIEQARECAEAWDDLARRNPAIRAFLARLTTTSAWSEVFMAHLPILLAIVLRDNIRTKIQEKFPSFNMFDAMAPEPAPNGSGPVDVDSLLAGLTPADMQTMMNMFGNIPNMPGGPGGVT